MLEQVYARIEFQQRLRDVTEDEIEVCLRNMSSGQRCQLHYSDATLKIVRENGNFHLQNDSDQDERVISLFKKLNTGVFRRHDYVFVNRFRWGVWDSKDFVVKKVDTATLVVAKDRAPFDWGCKMDAKGNRITSMSCPEDSENLKNNPELVKTVSEALKKLDHRNYEQFCKDRYPFGFPWIKSEAKE